MRVRVIWSNRLAFHRLLARVHPRREAQIVVSWLLQDPWDVRLKKMAPVRRRPEPLVSPLTFGQ
jgi:hypothetical protein